MNGYLKNLNKMEFIITYACTGRCKHCSQGDHTNLGRQIDPDIMSYAIRFVAKKYDIQTVMTFGGEPLMYPEAVYKIHTAARDMKVPRRQLITNGYFTKDIQKITNVADELHDCGVNDILLSVDAFHQETIPLDAVRVFADKVKERGIHISLQPAWLVSRDDNNRYNKKTREILHSFSDLNIPIGEGNVIFPEGNAKKYLSDYFSDSQPENPYVEDPLDVKCLSFSPDGDVLNGNVYRQGISEIILNYRP